MHRKASRKTHSTNGVNIESSVTYNAVWTCERFVPSRMAQRAVYYKALVPVRTYCPCSWATGRNNSNESLRWRNFWMMSLGPDKKFKWQFSCFSFQVIYAKIPIFRAPDWPSRLNGCQFMTKKSNIYLGNPLGVYYINCPWNLLCELLPNCEKRICKAEFYGAFLHEETLLQTRSARAWLFLQKQLLLKQRKGGFLGVG